MPLIGSPRLSPEDRAAWGAFERRVKLYATANRLRLVQRERAAAVTLRAFGPAWCAVSWGKDSVVLADLVRRHRPDVPLCWVVTEPGENPDCYTVRDAFLSGGEVYREFVDLVQFVDGFLVVNDHE